MTNDVASFREFFTREHATTLKVLRAFPAEQSELKPHERSNTARSLAWTFVLEEIMLEKALRHEPVFGSFRPAPESWNEIIDTFEKQGAEIQRLLDESGDSFSGEVDFFVGPKTPGKIPTADFAWMMISDQIHHRGQLSVYLRMAGGKVPSIYGPSADEPWT